MQKIGKVLIIGIIFGFLFIFPATAQDNWIKEEMQLMYMDYLRIEGYMPSIDEDGDIFFKVSGDNFYIIIDENDVQFFRLYMGLNVNIEALEEAYLAANYANRHSKVAKIYISSDGKIAAVNTELLLNKPEDFIPVFRRALAVIRNAESNYKSQLN